MKVRIRNLSIDFIFKLKFLVCKEWLIREDGNLAYRLQNEESKLFLVELLIILLNR